MSNKISEEDKRNFSEYVECGNWSDAIQLLNKYVPLTPKEQIPAVDAFFSSGDDFYDGTNYYNLYLTDPEAMFRKHCYAFYDPLKWSELSKLIRQKLLNGQSGGANHSIDVVNAMRKTSKEIFDAYDTKKETLLKEIKNGSLEGAIYLLETYQYLFDCSEKEIKDVVISNHHVNQEVLNDVFKAMKFQEELRQKNALDGSELAAKSEASNGNHKASESETKDNVKMHKLKQADLNLLNETLNDLDISHPSSELER